jgi:hypothetical protein
MEDRKEYKGELFEAVKAMTLENARQIKAEVSIQLILKQLDEILAEIKGINDQLREGASCSNRKV